MWIFKFNRVIPFLLLVPIYWSVTLVEINENITQSNTQNTLSDQAYNQDSDAEDAA